MGRIRSIRRSIPTSMAITLMNSFIIARVDYCNRLFVGLPVYQTDRIQTVLNDAPRLVFDKSRKDHLTLFLRDRLHWLRACHRIQFTVALLVYKAINYLAQTTSPATVNPATQMTIDQNSDLQKKRSSSSRKLELNTERSRSHT